MPQFLSVQAQSLLRSLFKRNPANRLGAGPGGIAEIRNHPFFASIDFDRLLRRELNPPFRPAVSKSDETHTHNFDVEFTKKTPKDSPALPPSAAAHELFRGFSFVASSVLMEESRCALPSTRNPPAPARTTHGLVEARAGLEDYEMLEDLGVGTFAVCKRCVHRQTRTEYAVKIIQKHRRDATEEVDILLRYSHHPNIVKLHAVYEDDTHMYLILELCKGGELLDRILAQKYCTEFEAAEIMAKLANVVDYLHLNQVVHRDLKPSNVMYATAAGGSDAIRVIDFGFAKQLRAENGLLMTPCYTAQFVAPEVLKKQGYDQSADVWSLGICLFAMLTGKTPFATNPNDPPAEILRRVGEGRFTLTGGNWDCVSELAKDLVSRMLHVDPTKRLSAKQILAHPWIVQRNSLPTSKIYYESNDTSKIKGAINSTYEAIGGGATISPTPLCPVNASALARRRCQLRPKSLLGTS